MTVARWPAFATVMVVACAIAFQLARGPISPSSFKAFYCAGAIVDRGDDPYRVEPLRGCEHAVAPSELPAYAVEPAPLPGYALGAWALLARLSYRHAYQLYLALALAALAAAGLGIGRLTGTPAAWAVMALSALWLVNVRLAEMPPFATAGIVLCAWSMMRRRWWFAAAAAALVAFEPHSALPLWLAVFWLISPMRLPLAVAGALLLIADAAVGGPARAIEYFTHVLPLQAASEVHAADQFSLTHQLAVFGVSDAWALSIGSASYVVMCAISIAVSRRYAQRDDTGNASCALIPPAFVLLGGAFVHDIQFMTALPLALTMLARRFSVVNAVAALLLCVAWGSGAGKLPFAMDVVAAAAVVWYCARWLRPPVVALAAICALVAAGAAIGINRQPEKPTASAAPVTPIAASAWAPQAWSAYILATRGRSETLAVGNARKILVWIGLLMLIVDVSLAGYGANIKVMPSMTQRLTDIVEPPPSGSSQRQA